MSATAAASSSSAASPSAVQPVTFLSADEIEQQRLANLKLSDKLRKQAYQNQLLAKSSIGLGSNKKKGNVPPVLQRTEVSIDIQQKATRVTGGKRRFLCMLPFRITSTTSGSQIGTVTKMNTRNPIIYIQFPQGRMKLFGTLHSSSNTYLSIQYSTKSVPKNPPPVQVKALFTHMFVFSEWRWIGDVESNPEEHSLPLPEELSVEPIYMPTMRQGGSLPLSSEDQEERKEGDDSDIDMTQGSSATKSSATKPKAKRKRADRYDSDAESEESEAEIDYDEDDGAPTPTPTTSQRSRRTSTSEKKISYVEKSDEEEEEEAVEEEEEKVDDEDEEAQSESKESSAEEEAEEEKVSTPKVTAPKPKSSPSSKSSKSPKPKPKAKTTKQSSSSSESDISVEEIDSDDEPTTPKKTKKKPAAKLSASSSKSSPKPKKKKQRIASSDEEASEAANSDIEEVNVPADSRRPRRTAAATKVNYAVEGSEEEDEE